MAAIAVQFQLEPQVAGSLDTRLVGTSNDRPTGNKLFTGLLRYETDTDEWVYYDGSYSNVEANNWLTLSTNYTGGTGVTISSSNVISIGQDVATTSNVTFNSVLIDDLKVENRTDMVMSPGSSVSVMYPSTDNTTNLLIGYQSSTSRIDWRKILLQSRQDIKLMAYNETLGTPTSATSIILANTGTASTDKINYTAQGGHEFWKTETGQNGSIIVGDIDLRETGAISSDTLSRIQSSPDGTGGKLTFYTKEAGGSLTEKVVIKNDGAVICKNLIKTEDANGANNVALDSDGSIQCLTLTANQTIEVASSGNTVFGVSNTGVVTASDNIICKNVIKTADANGNYNITLDNDGSIICSSVTSNTYEVVNSGTTVFEVDSNGNVDARKYSVKSSDDNLSIIDNTYASTSNYDFAKGMVIAGTSNNAYFRVGVNRQANATDSRGEIWTNRQFQLYVHTQAIYVTGQYDHDFFVPAGKQIKLNGQGVATGSSDDRIKFNETLVENGLGVIDQVNIYKYDKVYKIGHTPENDPYKKEIGVIAQEIQQIPELAQSVCVNEVPDGGEEYFPNGVPMSVYYDQIHSYHIKATQELHQLVKTQQTTIDALNQVVQSLQTRIAALESIQ